MSEGKRRSKNDDSAAATFMGRAFRRVLPAIFWTLVVGGILFAIIWLGRLGRAKLSNDPKYQVPVREIESDVPPGMTREAFLDEVQYLAQLPEKVAFLDQALPEQLREAFVKHPWVAKVENVTLEPPRRILVVLQFRRPVLAVFWENRWRAVDANAILLPQNADSKSLPRFRGNPQPPGGPSGSAWGDPEVAQQARDVAKSR